LTVIANGFKIIEEHLNGQKVKFYFDGFNKLFLYWEVIVCEINFVLNQTVTKTKQP